MKGVKNVCCELSMEGVTKVFGSVVANDHIDFSLRRGEIHGLLGENGAGKSTLMNCLYGMFPPTSGRICIRGTPVQIHSPQDAIAQGIGMVHQHFMLISDLTVTENIILGLRQRREPLLDLSEAQEEIRRLSDRYGFDVDPEARVGELPVGVQQRVEILKVLYRKADIIVFDEATAMLTPQEVEHLFRVIRQMAREGKSIIMIVHKLEEVMEICDRVTTLRDGRVVGTVEIADTDPRALARMMVGREVVLDLPRKPCRPGGAALEARGLVVSDRHGHRAVDGVDLTLRKGEIFGLAGIDGNGQLELSEALTGLIPLRQGRITLEGELMKGGKPARFIRRGVAHIPQDRQKTGLVMEFGIDENLVLHGHDRPPYCARGVLRRGAIRDNAVKSVERFHIKTPGPGAPVGALSGGNQQKVILARELGGTPVLLVAVQPTRGLDIGATEFVRRKLLEQRDNGVAVLLVSTELDEVLALSDRVGVLHAGRLAAVFENGAYTVEQIGLLMAGVEEEKVREGAHEA